MIEKARQDLETNRQIIRQIRVDDRSKSIHDHQPSPQAFSARSILDSTVSCDVTERYTPLRGQRGKRERLGTRLGKPVYCQHMLHYGISGHFQALANVLKRRIKSVSPEKN